MTAGAILVFLLAADAGAPKPPRDHFAAIVKTLTAPSGTPPSASRSFAIADAELNAVYRENVRSLVSGWEKEASEAADKSGADTYRQYASEYRSLAHAAQHEWLRYREAAAKLAAARWPKVVGVEDVVRALVTEDRIRELRNSVEG
jgi:uncharacterized protein YecT (DUF1311 family)